MSTTRVFLCFANGLLLNGFFCRLLIGDKDIIKAVSYCLLQSGQNVRIGIKCSGYSSMA
jgi:hypothetical protein